MKLLCDWGRLIILGLARWSDPTKEPLNFGDSGKDAEHGTKALIKTPAFAAKDATGPSTPWELTAGCFGLQLAT